MDKQTTVTVAKTGQEARGVNRTSTLKGGKFLTFLMANEKYGLEILKVREIMGMMDVTSVPTTPAFIRGVINLRGKVIPVVDLRLKFGIEAKADTERTCIIVVHLAHTAQEMTMGIIVDEVSDVLDIDQNQIEPPPSFGADIRTDFILGMGKTDQKVMTLLDIDRVLTEQEVGLVESSAGEKGH
jgi:purine-binding chemotaxis protein CheW